MRINNSNSLRVVLRSGEQHDNKAVVKNKAEFRSLLSPVDVTLVIGEYCSINIESNCVSKISSCNSKIEAYVY